MKLTLKVTGERGTFPSQRKEPFTVCDFEDRELSMSLLASILRTVADEINPPMEYREVDA